MGVIRTASGWWEFEGDEPPGVFFARPDEGGGPDAVRAVLRIVDDIPDDIPDEVTADARVPQP